MGSLVRKLTRDLKRSLRSQPLRCNDAGGMNAAHAFITRIGAQSSARLKFDPN
jgi:hypothetical protein